MTTMNELAKEYDPEPPVHFDSAGKLAEKMLKVLEERGWIRHDVEDCDGHVCLIGALGLAYGQRPGDGHDMDDVPVVARVAAGVTEYLNRQGVVPFPDHIPSPTHVLYRFNDTYASDVTAVELALEYVIEQERKAESARGWKAGFEARAKEPASA